MTPCALFLMVVVGGFGVTSADVANAIHGVSAGTTANHSNGVFDPLAIHLAAATIRPDPASSLHTQTGMLNSSDHYILQIDGPMTPGRRQQLSDAGVVLGDYLPFNTYLVRVGKPDRQPRLLPLDFIRWMGRFENAWKIHPSIGRPQYDTEVRQKLAEQGRVAITATLFENSDLTATQIAVRAIDGIEIHWIDRVGPRDLLRLTARPDQIEALAAIAGVQFIEESEETRLYNSTTRWIVQSNIPRSTPLHDHGLTGAGQIVGILDTGVNLDHCSFVDADPIGPLHRKAHAINAWPGYSPGSENPSLHGTHVAGTLLGDAGVNDDTRGIAYGARFVLNTTPQHDGPSVYSRFELHFVQGAVLHTNSWGDWSTDYGSLTRGVDMFGYDHEDQLIVFACGNDPVGTNPQNAKNCISVGASMDAPNQDDYCIGGTGPTVDGRRKPEVYAPGCNTQSANMATCLTQALTGTSMAAPVVAGVATLAREYFLTGHHPSGVPIPENGFQPTSALLKAMLINTSIDMTGIPGYPSNLEGWGRLRADDAFYFHGDRRRLAVLADVWNANGLSTGAVVELPLLVASDDETLKITLAFTDPPGGVGIGNGPAWVNDLDLDVISPGGTTYLGNVFTGGVSVPGGSSDDRNNIEQVHVPSPQVGLWTVRVRAVAVNVNLQGYALLATGVVAADPATIAIDLPDGAPATVSPDVETEFAVDIIEGTDTLAPSTPTLHYRFDSGAFQTAPLTYESGSRFLARLPAGECNQTVEFYVSAQPTSGGSVTFPIAAPVSTFTAPVGTFTTIFDDNFESDLGWTVQNQSLVSGAWVRGVPAGNGIVGDPTSDFDNSGRCYLTGNANFQDVNGGPTRLISPAIDLAGTTDPQLTYARWFRDSAGGDALVVELSNDDGQSWTLVESAAPAPDWQQVTISVSDFVSPSAAVRLRFSTQDTPNNSFTEAAIDAVRITDFSCESTCTPADINNDGDVDGRDISRFAAIVLGSPPTAQERCAGDLGEPVNGQIGVADVDEFVNELLSAGE